MENEQFKIMLVDDDPDIIEFLSYNIKREGYQLKSFSNGKQALEGAKSYMPHLIVLDVMMPEMDGIETCQELKKIPDLDQTIIVFLTARSEDYSQLAGYDAGADDYITKPIKPKILLSKIKSLLRRYNGFSSAELPIENTQVVIGDLVIDKERYVVQHNKVEIVLPKKEFELLLLLTSRPNKVFTRDEIFDKIWDKNVIVGDRTIDVHIRKLREKIGIDNIKTIKGVGYKFEN